MSIIETRENIVNLLENIIRRSELMERQSGSRNLLELDLAMEDVRLLYREFEKLRKKTENDHLQTAVDISDSPRVKAVESTPPPVIKTSDAEVRNQDKPLQRATSTQIDQDQQTREQAPPKEPVAQSTAPAYNGVQEPKPADRTEEVNPSKTQTNEVPDIPDTAKPAKIASASASDSTAPEDGKSTEEPGSSPAKAVSEMYDQSQMLVGEKFSNEKYSIHERLAKIKEDKSIGLRMQQKPVSSIKQAIGLNEKFLFINELFNGDLKAYNASIEQLNSQPSIHEAFELLNKLTVEFQWDGQRSGETIEKFANLVQRRYMDA